MDVNLLGKILVRRGTSAERLQVVLDDGEPAWDTDYLQFFVGDGVTPGGVPISDKNDLQLGEGLTFLSGNGHNAVLGTTPTTIGLLAPPRVHLAASGDISSAGAQLSLTMNNVKIVYTYYDKNNSKAWVQTLSGTEVIDFRRATVYDAALDVNSYDGYTLTTTPLNYDVITYARSNETTFITLREQGRVWNIRAFLSGRGQRVTLWAEKVYDPAINDTDTWTAPTVRDFSAHGFATTAVILKDSPVIGNFMAEGGLGEGSYKFKLLSGEMPPGMFIKEDGYLGGIPTSVGDYTYSVGISSGYQRIILQNTLTVVTTGGDIEVN